MPGAAVTGGGVTVTVVITVAADDPRSAADDPRSEVFERGLIPGFARAAYDNFCSLKCEYIYNRNKRNVN